MKRSRFNETQVTAMEYEDPLLRPTKVTTGYGTALAAETITEYGAGTSAATRWVRVKSQIDAANWKEAVSWFDALGRGIRSQNIDPESGDVFSLTCYDNMGRVSKTSNPFRGYSAQSCSTANGSDDIYWTTTTYDAASRPWKVTTPDNAVVETTFGLATSGSQIGTVVTVEDQADKLRRSITNALGQLTRVDEPNGSNVLGAIDSPNQATIYDYDKLSNLTTVTQGSQTRTFSYNSLSRLISATNPESGTINYSYDPNGNLTQKLDARGVQTDYVYDGLNRVTNRNYSTPGDTPSNYQATPNVSYYYDNLTNAKGKLIKVTNGTGADRSTTEYTGFDILGRVTAHKQTTDSTDYVTGYTYNHGGALIEETYPSGRVVKNELYASGELSQVSSKESSSAIYKTYANDFAYTAAGAISSLKLGNGRFESTQFNNRLQPTQIALGSSVGNAGVLRIDYAYNSSGNNDNNGNLLSQTITVPGLSHPFVQTYTYDELNRLKSATETDNSTQTWKQTFSFDRYGNRRFDEANTTMPSSFSNQALTNPTISTSNNRLTSTGWTYDSAGNTVGDPDGRQFTYDAENKQVEVKNSGNASVGTYFFDGDGKRVKKVVPSTGETTIFVYDATAELIAEYSTIVQSTNDAKVQYLTQDNLGTPRINTDVMGVVTSRSDYLPYGEELTSQGNRSSSEKYQGDTVRQGFTGYEKDPEIDLEYANARMFENLYGRFTSPDPLLLSGRVGNPQTWCRYVYSRNNPLTFIDPSGLYEFAANASEDEKKKFRQALQDVEKARDEYKVGSTKYNRLNDVIKAYGGEVIKDANGKVISGDQNGVSVGFQKFSGKDKDTGGKAKPEFVSDPAGKTSANVSVTINTAILGNRSELAIVTAHEGQHVADAQSFAALDWVNGNVMKSPLNRNTYELEVRGYEITSFMLETQGNENARYEGVQLWSRGWKEADGQTTSAKRGINIDKFLENSSSYPDSKPSKQGRRYL
jgi:RHS repeat-associated protein